MAHLPNDTGSLRLALDLLGGAAPPAPEERGAGWLIASARLQTYDRRDGEWWPLIGLPVIHLARSSAEELLRALRRILQGSAPGFAWRSGDDALVGLQLSATPTGAAVEVGLDLGAFLAEVAGAPRRPGAELSLFRFAAAQGDLVRFSDALALELGVTEP
jgi:hypothetical protein